MASTSGDCDAAGGFGAPVPLHHPWSYNGPFDNLTLTFCFQLLPSISSIIRCWSFPMSIHCSAPRAPFVVFPPQPHTHPAHMIPVLCDGCLSNTRLGLIQETFPVGAASEVKACRFHNWMVVTPSEGTHLGWQAHAETVLLLNLH